jgi:glyoxylase I family protein
MATAFSHVAISCKDPIATERWYTKYFGFKRARVIPLGAEQIVFTKSDNMYLEIFQAKGDSPVGSATADGPAYPAWRHIAFQVDDVDAKLVEMGADARITQGPMSFDAFIPGWKTVWVLDPNDNVVEISQGYQDEANPPALG